MLLSQALHSRLYTWNGRNDQIHNRRGTTDTRQASLQTMPKPLPGPSRLSQILQNLNKAPRATLVGVKSITLTLAQRNDHFGAR